METPLLATISILCLLVIMGVVTHEIEVSTPIPPARLFKALVHDGDKLIPQILPQAIKSVDVLQGDGGIGTIKQINFGEGSQYKYVKHKVESIDEDKFIYIYSTFEGDALMGKVEKITSELRIELAGQDGGSKAKSTSVYYPVGEYELNEVEIKAGNERTMVLFKAIEAYLLANPNTCN